MPINTGTADDFILHKPAQILHDPNDNVNDNDKHNDNDNVNDNVLQDFYNFLVEVLQGFCRSCTNIL